MASVRVESFREAIRSNGGTAVAHVRRARTRTRSVGHWENARFIREEPQSLSDRYIGELSGHFAVFNQWTLINSSDEGRFMECVAPGAFTKTFEEHRDGIRCLLSHGRHPMYGEKPMGPIAELEEDGFGARYVVKLHNTSLNREFLPALKDGLYGASFRFRVTLEDLDLNPPRSEHNPEGIEQRVIREADVAEFGPVVWPAYQASTAGVKAPARAAPRHAPRRMMSQREWFLPPRRGC